MYARSCELAYPHPKHVLSRWFSFFPRWDMDGYPWRVYGIRRKHTKKTWPTKKQNPEFQLFFNQQKKFPKRPKKTNAPNPTSLPMDSSGIFFWNEGLCLPLTVDFLGEQGIDAGGLRPSELGAERWKVYPMGIQGWKCCLSGGNSTTFYLHPENWGKWSNLTHIFQMGWKPPTSRCAYLLGWKRESSLGNFLHVCLQGMY